MAQIGQKKTLQEYAETVWRLMLTAADMQLDKEDESLARWKASLGLGAGAATAAGKCHHRPTNYEES
ncbi:rho GDP dissociation inhibitor [Microbotryomycetes sp. JL201]|nr:rho GDP dissociation inhibitor [Microbotryomycetes sp. JL201]